MLNTNVVTLRQIIQNYRFIIPRYQRPYSWNEENIEALWNDIVFAWGVRNDDVRDYDQRNHFLGSMLTTDTAAASDSRLYVVDGQQRLTSLTILASALLDACIQHGVQINTLRQMFLSKPADFIELNEGDTYFKNMIIIPSRADNPSAARQRALSETIESDVQERIRDNYYTAYKCISRQLTDVSQNAKPTVLAGIIETFLDYLYIVRIHVPTSSNIIRIFRTLNDRGVDLSAGDITKSVIFESVLNNPGNLDLVANLWRETFDLIEPDGTDDPITDYIRHHYISTQHTYVSDKNLASVVEQYLKTRPVENTPTAVLFMRRLKEEATYYNRILQSATNHAMTNESLTAIRECLQITATYPALLAAQSLWQNDQENLYKFVRLTENFTFRYFHIQGNRSVESFEKIMMDVAKQIRTHQSPLEIVRRIYKERSADITFKNQFTIATMSKSQLVKYTFWRLENSSTLRLSDVMVKDIKISTAMPARANAHYARNDINPDVVKKIGNLIMWHGRQELNKQLLPLLNMTINRWPVTISTLRNAIQTFNQWNEAAINHRQSALAEIAVTVWSLDI